MNSAITSTMAKRLGLPANATPDAVLGAALAKFSDSSLNLDRVGQGTDPGISLQEAYGMSGTGTPEERLAEMKRKLAARFGLPATATLDEIFLKALSGDRDDYDPSAPGGIKKGPRQNWETAGAGMSKGAGDQHAAFSKRTKEIFGEINGRGQWTNSNHAFAEAQRRARLEMGNV